MPTIKLPYINNLHPPLLILTTLLAGSDNKEEQHPLPSMALNSRQMVTGFRIYQSDLLERMMELLSGSQANMKSGGV